VLRGLVTELSTETARFDLVTIDVGGAALIARVTNEATRELELVPGKPVWALVKAVSLRGHGI
jgi:molybdate transport system ATP-binding protein